MKKVYILNHTHWDRDWYKTSSELNVKLKRGLEELIFDIEEGRIKYYFLDGQIAVLEDVEKLLSPEMLERLLKLIRAKKIAVGPLYTMPDEYIPTAQTLIENINMAKKVAQRFDIPLANVLHLPDMFGHISQIPQIASMFNFDGVVAHRGININEVYVDWKYGEYSTKLMALPRLTGYYNPFLNDENYISEVDKFISETKDNFLDKPMIIFAGADHVFISGELSEKLEKYNKQSSEYQLEEISIFDLSKIFNEVEVSKGINGAQNDNSKMLILADVWSGRVDGKMANKRAENALYNDFDTFNAFNGTNDEQIFEYAAKNLLLNASHDSIYGCSVDGVHDDLMVRSNNVRNTVREYITQSVWKKEKTDHFIFQKFLDVYSSEITPGIRTVRARVFIPTHKEPAFNFNLMLNSKIIPYTILSDRTREELISDVNLVNYFPRRIVEIEFEDFFNGIELKQYEIVRNDESKQTTNTNKFEIKDKSVCFMSGNVDIKGIKFFIEKDFGDLYNFAFDKQREVSEFELSKISEVTDEATTKLILKTNEIFGAALQITMTHFIKRNSVKFDVELNNVGTDCFRLLAAIEKTNEDKWTTDIPFDVIENFEKPFNVDFKVEAPQTYPQTLSTISLKDKMLQHNALYQFGIDVINEEKYYSLVLARSVDVISKQKMSTRKIGAGPWIKTNSSKLIGTTKLSFEISSGEDHGYNQTLVDDSLYVQTNVKKEQKSLISINNNFIKKMRFTKDKITLVNTSSEPQEVQINNEKIHFKAKEIKTITLGVK